MSDNVFATIAFVIYACLVAFFAISDSDRKAADCTMGQGVMHYDQVSQRIVCIRK